ncbi:hypothetical protein B0T20DRAFT_391904 [Sordaria brevicollis]|uniref:HTH APSES-type domain-containing protein n=1 Tax=Sordaria brevicollis TaxID=83679 RepID=A0AAE0UDS3_SORBR|nr:hypothetical protein B0T20DRAFT_391904 [Sordaria brevicollis]
MLNQNPGLKDIAYSITGGAIKAQGYWMPYACARAVCATFCYQIAGALIPLFGPDFPSECISPGEPRYGLMVIKPELINDTMRKAHELYQRYGNWGGPSTSSSPARRPARPVSSRPQDRHHYTPYPNQDHRDRQQQHQRVGRSRRGLYDDRSYDNRQQPRVISAPQTPASNWTSHLPRPSAGPHPGVPTSTHSSYTYSERPPHRSAWTAVNNQPPSNSLDRYSLKRPLPSSEPEESVTHSDWSPRGQAPNPWLTAIPRSPQRTTASSPWTSQPGSANRSRTGSFSSMTSQQHPHGRLPSPSSLLPSPSSSLSSLASSSNSRTSPRPQLPPISKLCSLPVPSSGRRRLPNARPSRVVGGGEETSSLTRHEEDRTRNGVYQFTAGYQRALTPPSVTSPTLQEWSQTKPLAISQQTKRIAVEANMDGDDTEDQHSRPPLSRTSSSTSLAANENANDTNNSNINQALNSHGRDEGQTSLAARKTAALTLLHLRQQEEEKEAAAAALAAASTSSSTPSSSPVSPPPTAGQPSPSLSSMGTSTTTTAVASNITGPAAPPPSPSSNYLGSPTSTAIASSPSSSVCKSTASSREGSVTATARNERRNEVSDADDEGEGDADFDPEQHRRKRRRMVLVGRAKSF